MKPPHPDGRPVPATFHIRGKVFPVHPLDDWGLDERIIAQRFFGVTPTDLAAAAAGVRDWEKDMGLVLCAAYLSAAGDLSFDELADLRPSEIVLIEEV